MARNTLWKGGFRVIYDFLIVCVFFVKVAMKIPLQPLPSLLGISLEFISMFNRISNLTLTYFNKTKHQAH